MTKLIKEFKIDDLFVKIFPDRAAMGKASAQEAAEKIKDLLKNKSEIRIVFAAAPSQNEFLDELVKTEGIEWNRIIAFHMDEYIGLNENGVQLFSKYLKDRIFDKVDFKEVHLINPKDNPEEEVENYETLLKENPIDIVFMGIGENGHIAFNDPPVADFNDSKFVKIVELDEPCRQQQVNDGCFSSFDEVPKRAITLTVPALMSGNYLFVVVPGIRKANAVSKTLNGGIITNCPASILRTHKNAVLYLDKDSSLELSL
ncbi:MAG: glucosamine-6-phosphate deaminase [Ignavibacteriaceae bacterium]